MPQLELAHYIPQIFWLLIVFSILYGMLKLYFLPIIRDVIQDRQIRIDNDLSRAEVLKKEAEIIKEELDSLLIKARHQASHLLNETHENIGKIEFERIESLKTTLSIQSKEAEEKIHAIKDESIKELKPVIAKTVLKLYNKITNTEISDKKITSAIDNIAN